MINCVKKFEPDLVLIPEFDGTGVHQGSRKYMGPIAEFRE